MKRFLVAAAAAATLALAAPLAGAQYPTTTDDPTYTQTSPTPPPVDSPTTVEDDNMAPSAPTTAPVEPADPATDTTAQTTTQPAPSTYGQTDTTAGQYASQTPSDAGAMMSQASLQEAALEAGMNGVPMTAAEVCAARDVELGVSRLTHETRKQLRFAADRASVCEINRVVINAPSGRADSVRQVLIEHGFDDADIEVQEASELGVELTFAGVATSSEHYAAMYNPQQLASYQAPASPSYAPAPGAGANTPQSPPETDTTTTAPMDHGAHDPDAATTEEDTTL